MRTDCLRKMSQTVFFDIKNEKKKASMEKYDMMNLKINK